MITSKKDIQHAITKSQHCQRNWDLSQKIPEDDLKLMIHAVTQCPSKQNESHYKVTIVTNRNIIEQIHNCTKGFKHHSLPDTINNPKTNPQVLANAVFAFTIIEKEPKHSEDSWIEEITKETKKQRFLSIGIASGYLNLTATMLGYSTGCCSCIHDAKKIEELIGVNPELLMGVGIKNIKRNRREHHLEPNFMFPSFIKKIDYQILD
jgi:nitroreductase